MTKQERLEEIEARLERYNQTIENFRNAMNKANAEIAELNKGMTLAEIKQAIADGETVCWASDNYEILKDCIGQFLIHSRYNDHYVGLTEAYVKDCYIKRD